MVRIKYFLFAIACLFSAPFLALAQSTVVKLCTEYTKTPLGIDVKKPRFSWQMKSEVSGASQKAYRIAVFDEQGTKVWDSRKKESGSSLNIGYDGSFLKTQTRYRWQVEVWDQKNKKTMASSWFETGLMMEDESFSDAWEGAKWIGGGDEDLPFYASYLPVFKLSFTLQLDDKTISSKAGFVFGANDGRLLDKNMNIFGIESARDSSYVMVELDISPLINNQPAKLNVYRRGYALTDKKDAPLKSFVVPTNLIGKANKYDKHSVYISTVLGDTKIYIDTNSKEGLIGALNLNPLGSGGDYVAFPVIGEIGFLVPRGQVAYFSNVEIRNNRNPSNLLYASNRTPEKIEGGNKGNLKLLDPSKNSMPMLRSTFEVYDREIAKARLYVSARGIYEMYINGKRIGDDYFHPGATQYNKTMLYQTYDVTSAIVKGKNAIGAMMGEGWWSGASTFSGDYWNFFGDRQSLITKLVITYKDGKKEVVTSDPNKWKFFGDGPLVLGSFFQGEVFDATKEKAIAVWDMPIFNDSQWKNANEVLLKGNINIDKPGDKTLDVSDHSNMRMIGQFGETVKKIKTLQAISVEEIRPGVFIYDMGQNMAGVPNISLNGLLPGSKIVLRFAEVKYPAMEAYKDNKGMVMLENIRAAMSQEIYIAKGGNEIINPRFTYHGYRYIEITGLKQALPLNAVKGDVISSIHEFAGNYESSNTKVNKLWENIKWSSVANFMSIPTDCPQRNERLGWSGDISIFANTASYLANIPQFLRRHMLAMRDLQRSDGRFPDVAPLGVGFGETLWGSAGITVAWESYQQYGDNKLLEEHYDAMKQYMQYLIRGIDAKSGVLKENERGTWSSLGDWLSLEDSKNEKTLFWEAYLIYDLEIMGKIASILGKEEDAKGFLELVNNRKNFFEKTYIDQDSGKTVFRGKLIDTQTSYALPLAFNVLDGQNKKLAVNRFANTITRGNLTDQKVQAPPYSLMTGFIGTAWISKALSQSGRTDLAYRLLQQTSYPSWLYPIEQGATTIWERLNSFTHSDGFGGNNNMNSFNHYSFGAVGGWMFANSLGIARDETSPGFKHFILQPEPDPTGKMSYAKGYYEAMYGRIESGWKISGNEFNYEFLVPANTSATLSLKANNVANIYLDGKHMTKSNRVKYVKSELGKCFFELEAGSYEITVKESLGVQN
ncbi:MAG: alpha-L-rhamnosidase [Pedobacter sp.]|nr:MAG: alpha-L-rhamnosidase [Pedobacter sp.]